MSGIGWRTLSRLGRFAVAGIVASALLALALGIAIPRVVEHHVLGARLDAVSTLVRVLERTEVVPDMRDHLDGDALARFDRVVKDGLLGGENLRVKLWNPAGEIVYSDNAALVGQRFPPGDDLRSALGGEPTVEISDLSDAENRLDLDFGDRLLEFYVPLRDAGGSIVGVFEVYQDFAPFAAHLAAIRGAVWLSVGSGLSVLSVFLIIFFGATTRAAAREHAERGRLLRRLVRAQEEERRHLVGDLHDGLGQALTRVLYGLRGARNRLPERETEIAAELDRLEALVDEHSRALRRYMAEIRPRLVDDFGLERALKEHVRDQAAETDLRIDVDIEALPALPPAVGVTLFRAAQEAFMNVRKHAAATHAQLHVARRTRGIVLEVIDDGRGIDGAPEGLGLSYMRDRVASLGGTVRVTNRRDAGTRVTVKVPVGT